MNEIGIKSMAPNKEFIDEVWEKVEGKKCLWSELEGSSYEAFFATCMSSQILIDLGFGMGRIDNLIPGHSCRVHAVFWSAEVLKDVDKIVFALLQIIHAFELMRVECVVPSSSKSLKRLLEQIGFKLEGTMGNWYKGLEGFFDGDLYAIVVPKRG